MLAVTQEQFEAKSLEEKLLWLFRETQNGVVFDNRLFERIGSTQQQQLAGVADRLTKLEQGK